MSFVAAAVAGGAVVGGVAQAIGANRAANTQAAAGRDAIAEQQREFNIGQENLAPFREAGVQALGTLNNFDITTDPGYQFRLNQGTTAVENSAAAKGMQLSSANLKDLLRFGQDYASGEYQNSFNRKLSVANMGLGATNTGVQAGTQNAASIGNTITGIGNATAAGQVGVANAIGSAAGGVGNAFLLSSILGKPPTTTNPAANSALGSSADV